MGGQQADGKFESHTVQQSNDFSYKGNAGLQIKTDNAGVNDTDSEMTGYFRSTINREADKRTCQVLMQNISNKFSDFFQELGALKV